MQLPPPPARPGPGAPAGPVPSPPGLHGPVPTPLPPARLSSFLCQEAAYQTQWASRPVAALRLLNGAWQGESTAPAVRAYQPWGISVACYLTFVILLSREELLDIVSWEETAPHANAEGILRSGLCAYLGLPAVPREG